MLSKIFGVASATLLALSTPTTAAGTMLTSWYGPGFHGRLTANGEVYDVEEGQTLRKRGKLTDAYMRGYGSEYAPSSIWSAYNAITQVETSTRGTTAAKGRAQFARGTFGAGAVISKKAFAVARDLVTA